jgi:large subunit ribosomal protein L22
MTSTRTIIIPAAEKSSATSKSIRISPTKIASLLAKIRGKRYDLAQKIIKQNPIRVTELLLKLLKSAEKNLASKYEFKTSLSENLLIDEAFVNQGTILKRTQPRARGKAYRIEKKFSHITIKLKMIKEIQINQIEN